jgi:hypothetical protein
MFFEKKFNSLEVARGIIKNTGLDENLGILKQKKQMGTAEPKELLKLVMSLSACNLVQAMKADFIAEEIGEQHREAIVRDYILESLRNQDLMKLKDKQVSEEMRTAVMVVVGELQNFWNESEDPHGSGPGPRYYCVKEVLKRLGGQPNFDLHDALFELMYLQYKHYIKYFRGYLDKWE